MPTNPTAHQLWSKIIRFGQSTLSTSQDGADIGDSELQSCSNFIFDNGVLEKAGGLTKVNETPMDAAPVMGVFRSHDTYGNKTLLASCNGILKRWSTPNFVNVQANMAVGERVDFLNTMDATVVVNGVDEALEFSPRTNVIQKFGLEPPRFYKKIAYFESDETITHTHAGTTDTSFIKKTERTGKSKTSLKLTAEAATTDISYVSYSPAQNFSIFPNGGTLSDNDYICLDVLHRTRAYVDKIYVDFWTSAGTPDNYYRLTIQGDELDPIDQLNNKWTIIMARKSRCVAVGTPAWNNINRVYFTLLAKTGTSVVYIDNVYFKNTLIEIGSYSKNIEDFEGPLVDFHVVTGTLAEDTINFKSGNKAVTATTVGTVASFHRHISPVLNLNQYGDGVDSNVSDGISIWVRYGSATFNSFTLTLKSGASSLAKTWTKAAGFFPTPPAGSYAWRRLTALKSSFTGTAAVWASVDTIQFDIIVVAAPLTVTFDQLMLDQGQYVGVLSDFEAAETWTFTGVGSGGVNTDKTKLAEGLQSIYLSLQKGQTEHAARVLGAVRDCTVFDPAIDVSVGGTPLADSEFGGTTLVAEAFDKLYGATNPGSYWCSSGVMPHWIRYLLPVAKIVKRYSIVSTYIADQAYHPKAWLFQGSNDGTTWIGLDSQTDQVFGDYVQKFYDINNDVEYLYYRLWITASYGAGNSTDVAELILFDGQGTGTQASDDNDLISFWCYWNNFNYISSFKLQIDCNSGDFYTDYFEYEWTKDSIRLAENREDWSWPDLDNNAMDLDAKKSQFTRFGATASKGWNTVKGYRFIITCASNAESYFLVYLDNLVMKRGKMGLSGLYQWCCVFESPTALSAPSEWSTIAELKGTAALLSNLPISQDSNVMARHFFRKGGTMGDEARLDFSLFDNVVTVYSTNTQDESLGRALDEIDIPQGTIRVPLAAKFGPVFRGSVILYRDPEDLKRLWYSNPKYHYAWSELNLIMLDSDIQHIFLSDGMLYLSCKNGIRRISVPLGDVGPTSIEEIGDSKFCIAPYAATEAEGLTALVFYEGPYLFDGGSFQYIGGLIDTYFKSATYNLDEVVAFYADRHLYLSVKSNAGVRTLLDAYGPPVQWRTSGEDINCFCIFDGIGDNGEIYIGDSTGTVWLFNSGYETSSAMTTKDFAADGEETDEFRNIILTGILLIAKSTSATPGPLKITLRKNQTDVAGITLYASSTYLISGNLGSTYTVYQFDLRGVYAEVRGSTVGIKIEHATAKHCAIKSVKLTGEITPLLEYYE